MSAIGVAFPTFFHLLHQVKHEWTGRISFAETLDNVLGGITFKVSFISWPYLTGKFLKCGSYWKVLFFWILPLHRNRSFKHYQWILLPFKTDWLRLDLCIIKFIQLKCTIPGFYYIYTDVLLSQKYNFRIFSSPQKETSYSLAVTPFSAQSPSPHGKY